MHLYRARWVLPISRPPIIEGVVGVVGDRIAWVGVASEAPPGEVTDLGDAVLLPGLVNAHTHLELTAMRGFLEDLPFRRWLTRLTKARQEVMSGERVAASARVGIAEGLLAGITTFADTCESPVVHAALRDSGVRGIAFLEVFGPDPAQCSASLDGLRTKVDALRPCDTTLVRTGVSPHAPYSVSDALFEATARYARESSLPIAVHAAESAAELQLVRDGAGPFADALTARGIAVAPRGRSTIDMLEQTGVLAGQPLLIHCVRVDDADMATMSRHHVGVAHCPASNAKLGHGIAPLAELLDAGIAVGLGSDSVASNNRMDLLDEARLAILAQRIRSGSHDTFPAEGALGLATLGSAHSLGMEAEIGSLDVGKSADLAAFRLDGESDATTYDAVSALVFGRAGRRAQLVMVAGTALVEDGELRQDLSADLETLREAGQELARFATSR